MEMLQSTWTLANRLGCVMVACLVTTDAAKALLKQFGVPALLNRQMVSNSAGVRAAALVAIQAFSEKATAAAGKKQQRQGGAALSLWPQSSFAGMGMNARMNARMNAPEHLCREVGDEILLLKEPIGVKLTHSGTDVSDVSQYLKQSNIVMPPMKRYRMESSLNLEAVPWKDSQTPFPEGGGV